MYGKAGDLPFTGDWTGQGYDTLGVFRPSNNTFYLRNSNTTGYADIQFIFGNSGDIPIAGRWSPNATHDGIGVYRPSNGVFYLKNELTSGSADYVVAYQGANLPNLAPLSHSWNGSTVGTGLFNNSGAGLIAPASVNNQFSLSSTICTNCNAVISPAPFSVSVAPSGPIYSGAGDWTYAGHSGIGVYDTNAMTFYLKNDLTGGAADNSFQITNAGAGWTPLAGHWVPPPKQTVGQCTVQLGGSVTEYFRIAPALDDKSTVDHNGENWLFQLPTGASGLGQAVLPTQARPWLWPSQNLPTSVLIQQLLPTGYVGVIPWNHANVSWIQIQAQLQLTFPGSGNPMPVTLTGYIENKDANGFPLLLTPNCASLPQFAPDAPTPAPVPTSTLVVPGMVSMFGNPPITFSTPSTPISTPNNPNYSMPAAVMGGCYFHNGIVQPPAYLCTPCTGACVGINNLTLDLTTNNMELCVDTRPQSRQAECDPNVTDTNGVIHAPVYSPVAGCATFNPDQDTVSIEVNINCSNRPQSRFEVVITHLTNPIQNRQVNIGDKIGDLCILNEWTRATPTPQPNGTPAPGSCSGSQAPLNPGIPVHVAFQLRFTNNGNVSYSWASPQDYLGFLSIPHCFYDRWQFSTGTPVPQASPIQGCP